MNSIGNAIDTQIEDSYFTADSFSNSESCLIVNWEKANGTGDSSSKWIGGFRWLGSFKKGTKGFVMFAEAKSSTSAASTLDLNGGIYFVEQDTSPNPAGGTVKKNKEITSQTIDSTTNTLDKFFPKIGTSLKEEVKNEISFDGKDYGGVLNGTSDLGNICTTSSDGTSCPTLSGTEPTKAWMGLFTHKSGDANKVGNGSENFETWSDKLFDNTKVNLNKILETFTGSGEKQTTTSAGG